MQQISLLQAQRQALSCVLDPVHAQGDSQSPWKVLVFDTPCQNILSTLYKVGDLRELCITLHLNINQKRERLHGVRVLYFITPTLENVQRILEDFQQDLYTQVVVNFCSPVSDTMLEQFAKGTARIPNAPTKIEKVLEHNLDFTSLASNLFTFNMENVYSQFKRGTDCIDRLTTHLYSLIATLKVSPLIIHQNKKTSKQVGQALISKLANYNEEYEPTIALLLLERDDDLNYVLQHSHTYGALMHDIFRIQNNNIRFKGEKGVVQYDLSPLSDSLWTQTINLPYPEATDTINTAFDAWKVEYDKVVGNGNNSSELSNTLSSALDMVPQLQQQKRTLDQHVNIASAILQHAKQRSLDKYQKCGIMITQNPQGSISAAKETLAIEYNKSDPDLLAEIARLQETDRTRVLILLLLNSPKTKQFQEEFLKLEAGAAIKEVALKKAIQYIKEKTQFGTAQTSEGPSDFKSMFFGLATKVKSHSKGLLQNVQQYLPSREKRCAVVTIIETLFEGSEGLFEFFQFYDQHRKKYLDSIQMSQITEIIVCVLEGGSLNEYAELAEYSKLTNRNIIYGGSQILNAQDLLTQFEKCVD